MFSAALGPTATLAFKAVRDLPFPGVPPLIMTALWQRTCRLPMPPFLDVVWRRAREWNARFLPEATGAGES